MTTNLLNRIKWLGHDGFEIATDEVTLMIDPFQVEGDRQADVILVTHPHYDHCSVDDIARLKKSSTVIVTEPESAEKLSAANLAGEIRIVKPGDSLTVSGILIEAVAAYNMDKHFHPKEKNWLGFIPHHWRRAGVPCRGYGPDSGNERSVRRHRPCCPFPEPMS